MVEPMVPHLEENQPVDRVPSVDEDPISRLYAHYFLQADVLYKCYSKLAEERARRGRLSRNKEVDENSFFKLWLAALYVVLEGFTEPVIQGALHRWKEISLDLRVHCGSINHKKSQLGEKLKFFRHATFHY
jgi:hypothetical protein